MCSLLQPRREWNSGRGAAGWLPRPAGSPGPNTALMRAGGADGPHMGGQGLLPRAKRSQRERERPEERRHQQGLLEQTWSPNIILQACVESDNVVFCFYDGLSWFGISVWICLQAHAHLTFVYACQVFTMLVDLKSFYSRLVTDLLCQVSPQINKSSTGKPPLEDVFW